MVPIVFAPTRVNEMSGIGVGPRLCESDQLRTLDVVVVAFVVSSARSVREGYVEVESPVSETGKFEKPATLPGSRASGTSTPAPSAT